MMRLLLLLLLAFTICARAGQHAIIEAKYGHVLGTAGDGKWVPFEKTKGAIKGGETYRLYSLSKALGTAKGGKPASVEEICEDVFTVPLKPKPDGAVIGVAGDWNALPRVPQSVATTPAVYQQAVADFLTSQGLRKPKVKITQILRIDLEGDGEEEVLISATNYFTKDGSVPNAAVAGTYSCVILRRVVEGKVQTQLVTGETYPTAKVFNAPNRYLIGAVLDLDGDGKMEVVVDSMYYEGDATTVFRCTGKKPVELLSVGCGA